MNPIQLKAIKAEAEKSNIPIEDLCQKYRISKEDLGDISDWDILENKPDIEVLTDNLSTPTPTNADSTSTTPTASTPQKQLVYGDVSMSKSQIQAKDDEEALDAEHIKLEIGKTAKVLLKEVQNKMVDMSTEDTDISDYKTLAQTLNQIKDLMIGKDPAIQVNVQAENVLMSDLRSIIKGATNDC